MLSATSLTTQLLCNSSLTCMTQAPGPAQSALLEVQVLQGGHGDDGKEAGEAHEDECAPAHQAVLDAVRHIHEVCNAVALPIAGDVLVSHCAQLGPYQPLDGPGHRVDVVEPAHA